jgi:hypothetical protein
VLILTTHSFKTHSSGYSGNVSVMSALKGKDDKTKKDTKDSKDPKDKKKKAVWREATGVKYIITCNPNRQNVVEVTK